MDGSNRAKIALIGFGEAGRIFAAGWDREGGTVVAAFDLKLADRATEATMRAACEAAGVVPAGTAAEALAGAAQVFSLVTADHAAQAAAEAARVIEREAFYFDCNSCSPLTKAANARLIEAAGAAYVDVAVMAPVLSQGHRTPLLLSGPHAVRGLDALAALGMRATIAGAGVGDASAIKMLRSVFIKGLEALTAESLLAARRAGVEDAVLASLQASDPGIDWPKRSAYNLERMMQHGARRAAEMREVAKTLSDYGLPNRLAAAIAEWHDEIAALDLVAGEETLATRLDRLLAARAG